ncbi:hypothetical protein GIB67_018630 [Kingdonia uniflora]|uniref:Uncharacterized protein n=1 Tax=Kingdonia uniflora TaxID=39325 RepID=A0A7J7M2H3_9MAGN|nr:hypothetical protein GIB67_018630 [Kingdonia uniflora]
MRTAPSPSTSTTTSTSATTMQSSLAHVPHSPWHSPVPYLFGGLAAMLGLIAFALLILACSYWKLSGNFDEEGENGQGDSENGDDKNGDTMKIPQVYEQKIVVIMAGDVKPSYLATPISSKSSSFGDDRSENNNKEVEKVEKTEKVKEESNDQEQNEHVVIEIAQLNSEQPNSHQNE